MCCWFYLKIEVWVHPHSEILCGAAVPFLFFKWISPDEKHDLLWFANDLLITIVLVCYQLEEPSIKPASWTLQNFGGYPECLKWSSQSRPVTDLVRTSRSKRQIHSHNFWVCKKLEMPQSPHVRNCVGKWYEVAQIVENKNMHNTTYILVFIYLHTYMTIHKNESWDYVEQLEITAW